jgi:signal peptidase I
MVVAMRTQPPADAISTGDDARGGRRWPRRVALATAAVVGALVLAVIGLRASGQLKVYVMAPVTSMSPTLHCGDHFAVLPYWSGGPQVNDVIVFHPPMAVGGGFLTAVKRVVGVGNDRILIRDGHVYVNRHLADHDPTPGAAFGPHTVAPGFYFVLGDNRNVSDDSRFYGDVPRSAVLGQVTGVYWPPSHMGRISGGPPTRAGPARC